jgi:hypothetical protein
MACFLVPAEEAIVIRALEKAMGEKARVWKLHWLNRMLWGGVLLLAIEHI